MMILSNNCPEHKRKKLTIVKTKVLVKILVYSQIPLKEESNKILAS